MDNGIWIGMLSALSALAGAAISQWGGYRLAGLQADRTEWREEAQWERAQSEKLSEKREEFLGFVLLAESLMVSRTERYLAGSLLSDQQTPASAARQAYSVALLYLADMRPLAKAFYDSTARLQLVFDGGDSSLLPVCSEAWRKSFSDIENALAKQVKA